MLMTAEEIISAYWHARSGGKIRFRWSPEAAATIASRPEMALALTQWRIA